MIQHFSITKGSTSVILHVQVYGTAAFPTVANGLTFDSVGLVAWAFRSGGTETQITLIDCTLGTYASGGFKALSSTKFPGGYELHVPNALLAAGSPQVTIVLSGVAAMDPAIINISLTDDVLAPLDTVDNYLDTEIAAIQSTMATAAALDAVDNFIDTEITAIQNKLTDIETDTQDLQARTAAALVNGRTPAYVGEMATAVITADAIAANAFGASEAAADLSTEIAAANPARVAGDNTIPD